MSYGTRYRIEHIQGGANLPIRILIQKKGYAGSVTTLKPGTTALSLETLRSDDLFEPPLRSRTATLTIWAESGFLMEHLFVEDNRLFQVVIERGPFLNGIYIPFFRGWVQPFDARDEYQKAPYSVTVTAHCGLGSLKETPFVEPDTLKRLRGRKTLLDFISLALLRCDYDYGLAISVGLREKLDSRTGNALEPFSWTSLESDAFWTKDGAMDCHEVLTRIMRAFGCVLVQDSGRWNIIEVSELPALASGGEIPYVSVESLLNTDFVSTPANAAITIAPSVFDKPLHGAQTSIEAAKRRIEGKLEYGEQATLLQNGDMANNGTLPDSWTAAPGAAFLLTGAGSGTPESPYALRVLTAAAKGTFLSYPDSWGAYQDVYFDLPEPCSLTLTGKFRNINNLAAKLQITHYIFLPAANDYSTRLGVLQMDGSWWVPGTSRVTRPDAHVSIDNYYRDGDTLRAKPDIGTFSLTLPAEYVNGPLLRGKFKIRIMVMRGVEIGNGEINSTAYTDYFDFKLTKSYADRPNLTGETVNIRLPGVPPTKAEPVTLNIGDQTSARVGNPILSVGALTRPDTSPTASWLIRGGNPATAGQQAPLVALLAERRLRMQGKNRRVWEGTVQGNFGPLQFLTFPDLPGCIFWPTSYQFNTVKGEIKIRAIEIVSAPRTSIYIKRLYIDGDGLALPLSVEGTEEAVVLPTNGKLTQTGFSPIGVVAGYFTPQGQVSPVTPKLGVFFTIKEVIKKLTRL